MSPTQTVTKRSAKPAKAEPLSDAQADGDLIRPFSRSLPMQLMRARELVMLRFRPCFTSHGLTDQQWRILRALADGGAMEILELSARCFIHAASLSRILPKMEAEGLLDRRPNIEDQRRVIVSLTSAGQALFERIAPDVERIYRDLGDSIGSGRLAEIETAMDMVIATLSATTPGAGRPRRSED